MNITPIDALQLQKIVSMARSPDLIKVLSLLNLSCLEECKLNCMLFVLAEFLFEDEMSNLLA